MRAVHAMPSRLALLAALCAAAACSGETPDPTVETAFDDAEVRRPTSRATRSAERPVAASHADDFRLTDHRGDSFQLSYYADAPAIVLMSQGNGCPIVRSAAADMAELVQRYEGEGVVFAMVNSVTADSRDEVAAEADEYGFSVPVLMDDRQLVGEQLGVQRTAEVFVIDPAQGFKVVYHGPLNDRQTYERQLNDAENHYVSDALADLVAGREVGVASVANAPGCLVRFPERENAAQHASISYVHDVAPILMDRCASCHSPGGIGPWAMTDFETVSAWTPMMREVIRTKRMPPWHADPHYGEFQDDRSLSDEQAKTIVHWIEAGAPRGEGTDPLAQADLSVPDWPLGEPDLILDLPAYTVPATGIVDYHYPVVENPLTEDRWLEATTIRAGAREVVHHVLSGYMSEVPADARGSTGRWEFSTGGYAVGAESTVHKDDAGVPFPAGGAIGFQMHYTPVGREMTDQTQIGFYFHDEVPTYINRTATIVDASIEIPPGVARHEEVAYVVFPHDAELIQAFPHAHYRGHASDLVLQTPDGEERVLLSLPKYDFNWQRSYIFEEPIDIPAGSRLVSTYVYDNSDANFANPDPETEVTWGEQSHEEMLYTSLLYRWKGETSANRMDERDAELERNRALYAMDDSMDGVLQREELRGLMGTPLAPHFDALDRDDSGALDLEELHRGYEMRRQQRSDAVSDDQPSAG